MIRGEIINLSMRQFLRYCTYAIKMKTGTTMLGLVRQSITVSRRAGPLSIDSVKTVYMLGFPLWIQFKDSRPPLELDKRAIQASAHFISIFQKRRGPSLKYCYLQSLRVSISFQYSHASSCRVRMIDSTYRAQVEAKYG